MEWLDVTAATGLWGLLAASFLSATVLPGGSEALFWAFLQGHPAELWPALALCTLGNTVGGMTSWWGGRVPPRWQRMEDLPYRGQVRRWGSPILLLAWAPVFGDALCLAAGWLRLSALPCCLFMAMGKFGRYWLLAQATLNT